MAEPRERRVYSRLRNVFTSGIELILGERSDPQLMSCEGSSFRNPGVLLSKKSRSRSRSHDLVGSVETRADIEAKEKTRNFQLTNSGETKTRRK